MANVEHSALTGADLHEPKGAAAAAANRVYVSNGSGSGSWTTVGNSVLAAEAKAFQAGLLHVRDEKTAGTDGGTFSGGSWQTRTLNTVVTNEISGASLSSNQITLPAGTYWVDAKAQSNFVGISKLRLRNVSDGTTAVVGLTGGDFDNARAICHLRQRFTIASSKTFELQHRCQSGETNTGFGDGLNLGEIEIFADVCIWKIA